MNPRFSFWMIVAAPVAGYALRLALETGALPPLDELMVLGFVTAAGLGLWRLLRGAPE
jgi:hypothetical protein